MFNLEPKITDLNITDKNVSRVLFSMNVHRVATPEGILEDARSYIIFLREGTVRSSAYIELLLLQTNRKLFYAHSSNPFYAEDAKAVEEEARVFTEGLGAMLDEVDMNKMSQAEKNHWIEEHILSTQKPSSESGAPVQEETTQVPQPAPASAQQPPVQQTVPVSQPPQPQSQTQPIQQVVEPPLQPQHLQQLTAKQEQEIMKQTIKARMAKSPGQTQDKQAQPAMGVVGRDREALARLLTSF